MNFFFTFLVFFIAIISNKIFLFNEEFLILLSFGGFCFIIYEKFGSSISFRFEEKSKFIEMSIVDSLNSITKKLIQKKELNKKIINLKNTFRSLKNYYFSFSSFFLNKFLVYLNNKHKNNLITNLQILTRLEIDYTKFILLLVNKKLNSIGLLTLFFGSTLKVKKFKLINTINRLALIKKI
uniref:ATP synthase F0 subunit b n=1 Tax=Polysiphonia morrowii TaxID=173542 RepID=UPI002E777D62|nr:ATP synthase F0 subunit b [Polysiphonia morrowii]WQF69602.1 ATP synthase F0 subunit b [Polysiphonia morrowii]